MGYHLGLTIADEFKHLCWNPRTGEEPPAGYGCRVVPVEKYNPDDAFRKLGIPLVIDIHHISKFKTKESFIEFIQFCVGQDKDILTAFHYGVLGRTVRLGTFVQWIEFTQRKKYYKIN